MNTESSDSNPFAPPQVASVVAPPAMFDTRRLRTRWMIAVAINLPIPVLFGVMVTSGFGRFGMLLGTAIVATTGYFLCRRNPSVMVRLNLGAIPVALLQVWPVLHMFVGMLAMETVRWLNTVVGGTSQGDMSGLFEITLATLLTGMGLILPSLLAGFVLGLFFGHRWK